MLPGFWQADSRAWQKENIRACSLGKHQASFAKPEIFGAIKCNFLQKQQFLPLETTAEAAFIRSLGWIALK